MQSACSIALTYQVCLVKTARPPWTIVFTLYKTTRHETAVSYSGVDRRKVAGGRVADFMEATIASNCIRTWCLRSSEEARGVWYRITIGSIFIRVNWYDLHSLRSLESRALAIVRCLGHHTQTCVAPRCCT